MIASPHNVTFINICFPSAKNALFPVPNKTSKCWAANGLCKGKCSSHVAALSSWEVEGDLGALSCEEECEKAPQTSPFLPLYYFFFMIQICICTFCIFIVNIKYYYYDAYDAYGYMLGFYDPGLWVTKFVENHGDSWDRRTILMLIHQCGSFKETKPESWHEFRVWG